MLYKHTVLFRPADPPFFASGKVNHSKDVNKTIWMDSIMTTSIIDQKYLKLYHKLYS